MSELKKVASDAVELKSAADHIRAERQAYCPTTIAQAIEYRSKNPQAQNRRRRHRRRRATEQASDRARRVLRSEPRRRATGLQTRKHQRRQSDRRRRRATWTELLALCEKEVPQFAEILSVFGSPQIRHVGTIGGNIINASPIADSTPFLFVAEAELELAGPSGRRKVNINNFYQGYKKFDLKPDELLASIRIPLPQPNELLRLFKVTRRRDLDISTFTAAVRLRLDGDTISQAAVSYGAVGPTVLRLRKTEQFLTGKPFTEETMDQAGEQAINEITPISDVRGSADYRYQLARNVLLKLYHEQAVTV